MSTEKIHKQITDTFQAESRIIIAALLSTLCDIELAEDALQDALVDALQQWSKNGIPRNPGAWMMTTTRRKAIDRLRRAETRSKYSSALYALQTFEQHQEETGIDTIPDERLKLIFTCCHPAIAIEAQIALTLQVVIGLSAEVIAKAFLTPKATMAQRLVRTKHKIRDAGIPYEIPAVDKFQERIDAVLSVIYFIFNAGYTAPVGDDLMQANLCEEAIRLARTLYQLLENHADDATHAETLGLLSLMILHHARHTSRLESNGNMLLLEQQNRALWHQDAIAEGIALLDKALLFRKRGPYQIQAAIIALHSEASSIQTTDWKQIALLYNALMDFMPSSVVELNRIVAVAMLEGFETGLTLLKQLENQNRLEQYYLFHATRADFLRRLSQTQEARMAYIKAIQLCENQIERQFLERRLVEVSSQ